jgi:hypothetical protein
MPKQYGSMLLRVAASIHQGTCSLEVDGFQSDAIHNGKFLR